MVSGDRLLWGRGGFELRSLVGRTPVRGHNRSPLTDGDAYAVTPCHAVRAQGQRVAEMGGWDLADIPKYISGCYW